MNTNLLSRRHRSRCQNHEITISSESENPENKNNNKRLLTLELMLNIRRKRRSSSRSISHYYVELITTTIVIFILLVMGNEHYFSSSNHFLIQGVGSVEISNNPYTNSKIFIHNRTSTGTISPNSKGVPSTVNNNNSNKTKSRNKPQSNLKNKTTKPIPKKSKKPTGTGESSPKPTAHPVINTFNANNYHNYFTTAINFLMTGLSSTTKRPKFGKQKQKHHEFLPTPLPQKNTVSSTIHPLAVLETEIKNISTPTPEGRSNLEYEPLFEASYDANNNDSSFSSSSSGIKSPKNLHANFFDKFEDHYDDPIAEESKAPEAFADFTGGTGGTGPVASVVRPPFRYNGPHSWKKPGGRKPKPESDYALSGSSREIDSIPSGGTLSYDTTGASGSEPGYDNEDHTAHKHVKYWPQNLNSYYGDQFTAQYNNNLYGRRPSLGPNPAFSHFDKNKFFKDHQQPEIVHFKNHKPPKIQNENPVNDINEASESVKKVGMMERVSVFYSEYKLFTWAVVSIVAALAAVGVILAMYLNNPPTEVVTAKRELIKSLNEDPLIQKFLENLMHKNNKDSELAGNAVINKPKSRRKGQLKPTPKAKELSRTHEDVTTS